ncbi:MAG: hypothetical protein ABIH23_10670 [bacterium]
MRDHVVPFGIVLLVFCFLSVSPVSAQTRIKIGQAVNGSIVSGQAAPAYIFSGTGGSLVTVTCDAPNRDVALTVSLYDPFGNRLGVNSGRNYPEFFGAYLVVTLPSWSDFTIRVEGDILTEESSAAFRLTMREYYWDEQDGTALSRDKTFEGLIAPDGDYDIFGIYLEKSRVPLWITMRTPNDILDGYLRVFTENWDLLGANDDLIDTSPSVLFSVPKSGVYYIVVEGSYWDSVGPYELTVQSVWEVAPDDQFPDEIYHVGESVAYFIELSTDDVITIEVESQTPGFKPGFLLFDVWRRLITINQASESADTAGIRGYTPVAAGLYVAIVFGAFDEEVGEYTFTSRLESDEPDPRLIVPGEDTDGILGPVGDTDTFTFEGSSGDRFSIWAWPVDTSTFPLDPVVRLVGPSGGTVAENDDAVGVEGSLISGVYLEETGIHTVEVLASPLLPDATSAAGPYILSVSEGTPFDFEPPRVSYSAVAYEYGAGRADITLSAEAVNDDTWPVRAELTLDRTGETQNAILERGSGAQYEFTAEPEDIFFLVLEDSADSPRATDPLLIPPPELVAEEVGMPFGLAVRETGEVLFIDTYGGAIIEMDTAGNTTVLSDKISTKGGVLGPNALAFDHQGRLYLSNAATGGIVRYGAQGATETVVTGLNFPMSLAFDAADQLYVCLLGSDEVVRVEPNGSLTTITNGIRNPSDLAFGPNGDLYVTTNDTGNGTVYRVDMDGTVTMLLDPFASALDSLAFDTEGNLYLADGSEGWIWRLSADGHLKKFAWGFSGPTDIAFGRGGESHVLFIASMGATWSSYFSWSVSRAKTGKRGLPLPYSGTGVEDWFLY